MHTSHPEAHLLKEFTLRADLALQRLHAAHMSTSSPATDTCVNLFDQCALM